MEYVLSDRIQGFEPSLIRQINKRCKGTNTIMFSAGNPSAEAFPLKEIKEIAEELMEKSQEEFLQYGLTEGYMPLRELMKRRLKETLDAGQDFDQILITSGSQQIVDAACKAMLNEGDTVLCENPSYLGTTNIFRSYNANLVGIPLEEDGISITSLKSAIQKEKRIRFLYTIPTLQNPGCTIMSVTKRKKVYELCKDNGIIIIEDNPYGELMFSGKQEKPIKAMDTNGIVLYCGSFSKVFAPGSRIGYGYGPEKMMKKIILAKQVNDVFTNTFFQMMICKFMTEYDYNAHIYRIQKLYEKKARIMEEDLLKELPEWKFQKPKGGLFIWCNLPEQINVMEFFEKAMRHGVAVVPGKAFMAHPDDSCNSVRLSYATSTADQIHEGIRLLSQVMDEYR